MPTEPNLTMKIIKAAFVTLILTQMILSAKAQSIDKFDLVLGAGKYSMTHFIKTYADTTDDFKLIYLRKPEMYSVCYYGKLEDVFGQWSYTCRNDTLNQYGFVANYGITQEIYTKLQKATTTIIKDLTIKYGQPLKAATNSAYKFSKNAKLFPTNIKKAMWQINGQKLLVTFSVEGEHSEYTYSLRVSRFKDYRGNMKLPDYWDGY
jgi:hypothetical protein